MVETVSKLVLQAKDDTGNAFKAAAESIARFTQQTAKSQRTLVDSHKAAVDTIAATASKAGSSLNSLIGGLGVGIPLGIAGITAAAAKAVTVFASVDQQQRALAVFNWREA